MLRISSRNHKKNILVSRERTKSDRGHTYSTPIQICRDELPPVVYFIGTDDGLVKIGHTTQLHLRKGKFGPGWARVLAVVPGTRADESAMHELHSAHLAHGREWFYPHPDLIAHIDEIRERYGVPPTDWFADTV